MHTQSGTVSELHNRPKAKYDCKQPDCDFRATTGFSLGDHLNANPSHVTEEQAAARILRKKYNKPRKTQSLAAAGKLASSGKNFCTNCGTSLQSTHRFCGHCGEKK